MSIVAFRTHHIVLAVIDIQSLWLHTNYCELRSSYYQDINNFEDWYSITYHQLTLAGGGGLPQRYHSLSHLLTTVYPEYQSVLTFYDLHV